MLQQLDKGFTDFWLGPRAAGEQDLSRRIGEALDRSWHYIASRRSLGLSPMAVAEAYFDWMIHLAASPGKQLQLAEKAARKAARLADYAAHCALRSNGVGPCIVPLAQDKRSRGEAWQQWPFNIIHQSFLLQQQWWHVATTGIRGLGDKHEAQVTFATRQSLDMVSPSNFVSTNPEILQRHWQKEAAILCGATGTSSRTGSAWQAAGPRTGPMPSRSAAIWPSPPERSFIETN